MNNILITGGGGGLGSAFKKKLNNSQFKIFTHSCYSESDIKADFTQEKDIKKVRKFILDNKINYLINNAGLYSNKTIENISVKEINDIIKVNLLTPIILSKYIYESVKQNKTNGLIVNINSLAGKYPSYVESVYCASKFGLTGFGSCLSINQKKSNVKIIDCHIGAMKTKMTSDRENKDSLMDPEEVANFIIDILTSKTQYTLSSFELRNSK